MARTFKKARIAAESPEHTWFGRALTPLVQAVRLRKNVPNSGGPRTGKASFLNALSAAIPAAERIFVIEVSSELRPAQPHTV